MSCVPDPKSHTGKARLWFEQNPSVEVTPHELCTRHNLTKIQAYGVIRNLKLQGVCESVRIVRLKRAKT